MTRPTLTLVPGAQRATPTRLYFAHIPKTAGITMKAFFESNYDAGASVVLDEQAAGTVTRDDLRACGFISSHYSYEVLKALGEPPDVLTMLVREPLARFKSWLAHGRRSSMEAYRATCTQGDALTVLRASDSYAARQAHWVGRTFLAGPEYKEVPSFADVRAMMAHVDIVGIVEEIERFKQLVAYRMGWRTPAVGWKFNQRPTADIGAVSAGGQPVARPGPSAEAEQDETWSPETEAEARRLLDVDQHLYDYATERFWTAYAAMLSEVHPQGIEVTPALAQQTPVVVAREWLLARHRRQLSARAGAVEHLVIDGRHPLEGDGWWWRETVNGSSYFWSGPEHESTLDLPPLIEGQRYRLTVDLMGAASAEIGQGISLQVNGAPVSVVRERFLPKEQDGVSFRVHAILTAEDVARQRGGTALVLRVPDTTRLFAHVLAQHSSDTFNYDTRKVGLALHRVRIERAKAEPAPVLTLTRPEAA